MPLIEPQVERPRVFSRDWWASWSGVATALGTLGTVAGVVVAVILANQPSPQPVPPDRSGARARTPWLGIEFFQDDKRLPLYETEVADAGGSASGHGVMEVDVGSQPFEIRAPLPAGDSDAAIKICAWVDASVFGAVREGEPIDEVSPFTPGKGMADTAAGSGALYLDKEGFNYLGDTRVSISGKQMVAFVSEFEATDGPQPAPSDPIYLLIYVESGDDGDGFGDAAISNKEYDLVVVTR